MFGFLKKDKTIGKPVSRTGFSDIPSNKKSELAKAAILKRIEYDLTNNGPQNLLKLLSAEKILIIEKALDPKGSIVRDKFGNTNIHVTSMIGYQGSLKNYKKSLHK